MSCYESGKFFGAVFVTDLILWFSLEEWECDGDAQDFLKEDLCCCLSMFTESYGVLLGLICIDMASVLLSIDYVWMMLVAV